MPDYCESLIDHLIIQRKSAGLTQKDLADAANLTQSVIARLESKKTVPQLDTLLKVVKALKCTLEIVPDKSGCRNNSK